MLIFYDYELLYDNLFQTALCIDKHLSLYYSFLFLFLLTISTFFMNLFLLIFFCIIWKKHLYVWRFRAILKGKKTRNKIIRKKKNGVNLKLIYGEILWNIFMKVYDWVRCDKSYSSRHLWQYLWIEGNLRYTFFFSFAIHGTWEFMLLMFQIALIFFNSRADEEII